MIEDSLEGRMSAAETWIQQHDERCAERYGELKQTVSWLVRGVFGMLVAIVAWLAIQLWNGSQDQIRALEQARTAAPHGKRASPSQTSTASRNGWISSQESSWEEPVETT
jgi:hypothetical protein